jgi:hypothetical protein
MSGADELQHLLVTARNPDGGWPFRKGLSWTEPSALALLALNSRNAPGEAHDQAVHWLVSRQNSDGGWPPNKAVPQSTWVTSVAALALATDSGHVARCSAAAEWLAHQVYPEPTMLDQFLHRAIGMDQSRASGSSPWFPGNAGWVIPTSMSIIALSKAAKLTKNPQFQRQAGRAKDYLLSRRCADGGWNHGGSKFRSENAASYPETTGIALLALTGVSPTELAPALRLADLFLQHADSLEGVCWLQMALQAHNKPRQNSTYDLPARTLRDISLHLLALAPPERNALIQTT